MQLKTRSLANALLGVVVACGVSVSASAAPLGQAADHLVAGQLHTTGSDNGSWPSEPGFSGESIVGLCHAYTLTGNAAYKTAAEAAGSFSLRSAGYNAARGTFAMGLYPTEAYAMACLSQIQANPSSNSWRTALVANLGVLSATSAISQFRANEEDTAAVYDVARWTVAAYYVGYSSKDTWRNGLLTLLGDVDNSDATPTMAVGAALWGLASTGIISTDTRQVWQGVKVNQLPGFLAGLRAPDGSFYTKFDTVSGQGYTETTAMAALGLKAADPILYASQVASAINVLDGGVASPSGAVDWQIGHPASGSYYFLGGETLEVIPAPGDADWNGSVDAADYLALKSHFGAASGATWAQGDFDNDKGVDGDDLHLLEAYFGQGISQPSGLGGVQTVPEPATLGLLVLGGLAILRGRRRRGALGHRA